MSDDEPFTGYKTTLREYRTYSDRFLKKSFAPSEYFIRTNGEIYVPWWNVERLQNEAACLRYLRENTSIPVPRVLDAYEKDGSFYLWTELIQGVMMADLKEVDKLKVLPQVLAYVEVLQTLQSKESGGPSGILCPKYTHIEISDTDSPDRNTTWKSISSSENDQFVFCHCDLSQTNILVDPETLKVLAIIDWEYGGYYPKSHEIPFYEKRTPSGAQVHKYPERIAKINEWWDELKVVKPSHLETSHPNSPTP